jgi:hypothetical protein
LGSESLGNPEISDPGGRDFVTLLWGDFSFFSMVYGTKRVARCDTLLGLAGCSAAEKSAGDGVFPCALLHLHQDRKVTRVSVPQAEKLRASCVELRDVPNIQLSKSNLALARRAGRLQPSRIGSRIAPIIPTELWAQFGTAHKPVLFVRSRFQAAESPRPFAGRSDAPSSEANGRSYGRVKDTKALPLAATTYCLPEIS